MKNKETKRINTLTTMNKKHRLKLRLVTVFVALFAVALFFSACGELNFDNMNTDPTSTTAETLDPGLLFSTTELSVSGTRYEVWRANLIQSENFVQQLVCTFYTGGNNYSVNQDWEHAFFNAAYSGGPNGPNPAQVKNIETVIHLLKQKKKNNNAKIANKLAEARILRVFIYSRITDLYGDIPYFDAGKGAIDNNIAPKYDSQKDIYTDFFKELDEAVKQFDSSQPTFGDHDLIYGGDINEWKKWANSLRLRFALRLTKVDPATAEKQAKAALNADGGVMTSNDDIAFIPQTTGGGAPAINLNQNPNSEVFTGGGDHEFIGKAFMQWMKSRNDPRLAAYAEKGSSGKYIGFPSGYNNNNFKTHPGSNPDSLEEYSRVNLSLADLTDPFILQTYAEVQLMQAEAAVRGWSSGSATSHYKKGVTAAMKYLSLYDNGGSQTNEDISQSAIDNYLTAKPFKASGSKDQKIEQINDQYWAAVFLNGYEAFANWRRSGYPNLQPALVDSPDPAPGSVTGKTIPRRLLYPDADEDDLNKKNYQAALDRQGPNKMTTRVWWDAKK